MNPRVLRELADVVAKPLSIIFENSSVRWSPWWLEKRKLTHIFKKGRKEESGNYRAVIPSEILQILQLQQMGDGKVQGCMFIGKCSGTLWSWLESIFLINFFTQI